MTQASVGRKLHEDNPMRSPFPGMDPYLALHWRDTHAALVVYASDHLNQVLPIDLVARIDGSEWFDESDHEHVERHILILDVGSDDRRITQIKFLSPSNKIPGPDRLRYLRKQQDYLDGGVNLVEVDLIRSGIFTLAVPVGSIDQHFRTDYQICVRRMMRPDEAEIYRAPLREKLPTIRIPLRPKDKDVPLDLQDLIDQCYRRGRYNTINYNADPAPPLSLPDARWADELLRTAGLRQDVAGKGRNDGS